MSKETGVSRRDLLRVFGYFAGSLPLLVPGAVALKNILGEDEPEEIQSISTSPAQKESPAKVETGIDLLKDLGLRDRVVYIVYGRPQVHGVPRWGSLGMGDCCRTAEDSWDLYRARKEFISQEIGRDWDDFAFNVINPVYDNQGDLIRDIYVDEALELASGKRRLVAFDFKNIEFARATIKRFETIFPKERLAHLAVSFDAEHFPSSQVDARAINEFSTWFGQKHQAWSEGKPVPGLVFIYLFPGSKILNLSELKQYYLDQKTLTFPLFDGWGTYGGKKSGINEVVRQLPDSEAFPAFIGAMEFKATWGDTYDQCTIKQTYEALKGPVKILASQ